MKGRDVILAAAVVAVAGVAIADSLRSDTNGEGSQGVSGRREAGVRPETGPPAGWRRGLLAGTLVFTDSKDCRIRVIGLAGGRERPMRPLRGTCQMWAGATSERVAYAPGLAFEESATFTFVDLFEPIRDFGTHTTSGPILWSPDGRRAAWCEPDGDGVEMNIPANSIGRLRDCPVAYTTDGEPASIAGNRLVVGGRTVLETTGRITYADWGVDGSVAVVVEGRFLERWEGRTLTHELELPGRLRVAPILSPDNCAVLLLRQLESAFELRDLGCFRGDVLNNVFLGTTAAWSPDGEWIAISEGRNSVLINFVRVVGGDEAMHWDAGAVELVWRGPRAS